MKKNLPILLLPAIFGIFLLNACQNNNIKNLRPPAPTEGEENEELREKYNELRHKTAPGVEWKLIEAENARQAAAQRNVAGRTSSFANGHLNGVWEERGSINLAGNVRAVDYDALSNTLYTLGNGGSLWKSTLGSGTWNLLNQANQFEPGALKVFNKLSGGLRILLSDETGLFYSDDDGATVIRALTFPVSWGGNYAQDFYVLNNGSNTVYCLARVWSPSPWASRYKLYYSSNQGQTFAEIKQFDTGSDDMVSACVPYNTNSLLAAEISASNNNLRMHSASGSTVTEIASYNTAITNSKLTLKGTSNGSTHLYAMINNNRLFYSNDLGTSWQTRPSLPATGWDKMNVSINDPLKVCFGGVNAYRSTDGGVSFTLINDWSAYYSNISGKLHADIMEMEYFKKTDGTEFCIVDCHGGTYVSYDNLVTVSNLSLNNHRVGEIYDVLTDTLNPSRIFLGTQDQGAQRTLTGTSAGVQSFIQFYSGDYGQMAFTNNNTVLWPQYPGGNFYCWYNLGAANPSYYGAFSVLGSQKPNYGWMLATTATNNIASNEILVGGGNMTGGGGSYLIRASTSGVNTFSNTQYAYDFRANSNSGTAGITAIELSKLNNNLMYVATEDGTFFYSTDAGANWSKTASFNGPTPWYLYGSCILASTLNANTVWYSGSGYSNPGVYKSIDGGASFTAMNTGLPATLVNEMVATPDEQFIFAATESGPYVYVASENIWYPLADATVPVHNFTSVEYIRSQSLVRFATFGRGIWDFKITSVVPVTIADWKAQKQGKTVLCTWKTTQEINTSHYIVQKSNDGLSWKDAGTVAARGAGQYNFTDQHPWKGNNYYRLVDVDNNGSKHNSSTAIVNIDGELPVISIYPSPVKNNLFIKLSDPLVKSYSISISDAQGKIVLIQNVQALSTAANNINVSALPAGSYVLTLRWGSITSSQQFIKQ